MRSKEERSGKKEAERNESKVDVGRLKSPRTVRGEPSSGKELIKASSSLMNSPKVDEGRLTSPRTVRSVSQFWVTLTSYI